MKIIRWDGSLIAEGDNLKELVIANKANLSGANLSGADLTGTNLTGANLTGANLMDVRITVTQIGDILDCIGVIICMTHKYYFTFGHGHYDNGVHLLGSYTWVAAETENEARHLMIQRRGNKWCTSYVSELDAGVERFGLKYIAFEELELVLPVGSS